MKGFKIAKGFCFTIGGIIAIFALILLVGSLTDELVTGMGDIDRDLLFYKEGRGIETLGTVMSPIMGQGLTAKEIREGKKNFVYTVKYSVPGEDKSYYANVQSNVVYHSKDNVKVYYEPGNPQNWAIPEMEEFEKPKAAIDYTYVAIYSSLLILGIFYIIIGIVLSIIESKVMKRRYERLKQEE